MEELRDLCRSNRCEVDDEQREAGQTRQQTEDHERTADDFESPDKVSGEIGIRESDLRKPQHAPVRVGELQDSLCEKDQPDGKTDQNG